MVSTMENEPEYPGEYQDIIVALRLIVPRKRNTPIAIRTQRNQINAMLWRLLRLSHTNLHIDKAPVPRETDPDYPIESDVEKWLENFGS